MHRSDNKFVPILTFHKVDPVFEWGVTRITPPMFRTVLSYLRQNGYESISFNTLLEPSSILPDKPVILTFDDSYESLYRYAAPVMSEFGYSGTLFVITGFVGKRNLWDVNLGWKTFSHLSWSQIQDLVKQDFEVGSHTVHHADLTRIRPADVNRELVFSKHTLEDKVGEETSIISFPFGRYDRFILDACNEAGYRGCCGYWIPDYDAKQDGDPVLFRRQSYYLFDRCWNLKKKLKPQPNISFENLKLRLINFFSHGSSIVKPARWSD